MASILTRTAVGAGWVVAWRMSTRLLGLMSTLVLARLLAPSDYGLVALAFACSATLDACLNAGVDQQIIRARNPSRALYDTAFTFNLLRTLSISALLLLGAAPLAAFFGDARLESVLLVFSVLPLLSGVTNIGVVDFQRNLAFHSEFRLLIVPRLVGVAVSFAIALTFRTHWALVLSAVAARSCTLVVSYRMHPFRPRLSLAAWRELAGVSFWIWAVSVAGVVRDLADRFFVGRMLGPAALGAYNLGAEIAVLPATEIISPICRACLPGFAVSQREGGDSAMRDAFLRILALTALLTLPAGFGIALVAAPLVYLTVGANWAAAVPVVAVIGAAGVALSFSQISQTMIQAHARMRLLFLLFAAGASLRLALMAALIPWLGLPGAALALGAGFLQDGLLQVHFAARLVQTRTRAVWRSCWRPAVATLGMTLIVWGTGLGGAAFPSSNAEAVWQLGAGGGLGILAFTALAGLLWLACGRPEGSEADLLRLIGQVSRQVFAKLRRAQRRPASAGEAG